SRPTSATAWGSRTPSFARGSGRREPVPRALETLSELHARRIPQNRLGLVDEGVVALDLALAGRLAPHPRRLAGRLADQLDEAGEARLDAARELEDLPSHARRRRGGDEAPREVLAVHEVARLAAVAVEHELLAGPQAADEERDDVALVRRPRAVGVREAHDDGVHAVGAVEGGAVRLAGGLGGAVRGERRDRLVLAGRIGVLAQGSVRRREHEPRYLGPAGGLERRQRSPAVLVEVRERIVHRLDHPGPRRQVEDDVAAASRADH